MNPRARRLAVGVLAAMGAAGCSSTPRAVADKDGMVGMLLPRQIRIQPFTKIKSFDDDRIPDGIAAVVRTTDSTGDPVKLVGHVYFELYAYKEASGERKGERIEFWDRTLATPADQKLYWDRTAQMYEFPLAWTQGAPPSKGRKYILAVTCRTPWEDTLTDEYVMELTINREEVAGARTGPGGTGR